MYKAIIQEFSHLKHREAELPPLPNVAKYPKVVTRFSPNPDCVLHIGNIRALILSHDYARKYDGKFILRFEDTDPRLKRSALVFYDLIEEDLIWLGCKWDEKFVQSDRLPIYYEWTRKLILVGGAYVCTCPSSDFKEKIRLGIACPCRILDPSDNLVRFEAMLNGAYREGEAVVRVRTDLNHPNPAVRDWPALRVIDTEKNPHPRVGSHYKAWPLYNLACGIDDHLMGITHIIRGKEHLTNTIRQQYMYRYLGWEFPEAIHYGRLKIVGIDLSKSKLMQAMAQGVYSDYSDPRLATIAALRRRGITSQALRSVIHEVGPRPVDATISWENVNAVNRKIIDPIANRYFFVADPVELEIEGVDHLYESAPPLHPDFPERGMRRLIVTPDHGKAYLLVSRRDQPILESKRFVRLMELFNIEFQESGTNLIKARFVSEPYSEARKHRAPLIHWLPRDGSNLRCSVVMPDASMLAGLCENTIINEHVGNLIQMVRTGFGRIDSINANSVTIYFAHP
jgi:glutamyl-tRNA synthetase